MDLKIIVHPLNSKINVEPQNNFFSFIDLLVWEKKEKKLKSQY